MVTPVIIYPALVSQPARAVWIEIDPMAAIATLVASQPARAVWIEIDKEKQVAQLLERHSLRGLCGLKSVKQEHVIRPAGVTACEGCVD